MSTLRKDFMIPSVACSSQEDQENMMLEVTLLSSEWKSSTDGDLSTINRELAIQLAKHPNVDVSVLLPNCSEADRSSAKSHNVKLIEADRVPGFEPVLRLLFPPRDHKMDCVIGHGIHLGRPIASIKRNPIYSHCKWIQVVHSAPEEDGMYKNISEGQKMQETEIQLCKMADQVITIGPKLTETYKGYLRPVKQEEKVFDLTPSIFSEFLAVEQATEDKTTFSILVIGTCNSSDEFNVKEYDIAAKAIAELRDESYKLKFVCTAGGKGVIVAEKLLLDDISRNQLIVRSLDDGTEVLANLFCEVDLAIMPSRTEGFGVTALKALSASLPVLVSGNSGLGKALKKVPLGSQSVVDSVDPKDWAKEIKRVRQKEKDVRLSESRLLREKYLEKYNWEEPCRSLVIKMKNLVFGKALHSSLDYEETERNKQGESIPGAAPNDSTKHAQRNVKEAWTAAAPNTSLKRKRTDGDEQTKSVKVKIPIWIDCGTIPDPHLRPETSGTVVIASQDTQAGSDGLVVAKTSGGTPQDTQDSQAGSHDLLVTGVQQVPLEAVEPVASAGQPFAGRTGSVEEAGAGNEAAPNVQEVLNFIALRYFKKVDPSKPEELYGFLQYLKEVRKVLVLEWKVGSLILTALCSSLEILDSLWYDYCTGHLNDMAQKYLVTEDVLKEFDLTELKLTTTIQMEEYIAARKFFLQGSERAPNTSLTSNTTDGNEQTKSVQAARSHDEASEINLMKSATSLKVTLLGSGWSSSTAGLSTINRQLAILLAKHSKVDVTLLVPQFACSEEEKRMASSHNVSIQEAKKLAGFRNPLEWLSFPPRDLVIDFVLGHGAKLGKQAQVIRTSHSCKWIQVVHTALYKNYPKAISRGEDKNTTEVELCKLADAVMAVGPKLTKAYSSYLRSCEKHQGIIQLTPSTFREFYDVKQAAIDRSKFMVLTFGSGDPEDLRLEGYDISAKAIVELRDNSYLLIFVCATDGKLVEVSDNLLQCGIGKNQLIVRSTQRIEELKMLFCQVDLCIMPSRTEDFGLKALEALSAGLPILVSGNSGFGEALCAVPSGKSFVVESEDPREWSKAIASVRQKERSDRLQDIQQVRSLYEEKYSWEKQCDFLVEKMWDIFHASERRDTSFSVRHVEVIGTSTEQLRVDSLLSPSSLDRIIQELQRMQLDASKVKNRIDLLLGLRNIASDRGFRISDNPGLGNCMFDALSEQLEIVQGIKIPHGELRQSLVQYLKGNRKLPDGTDLFHFVHGHQTWTEYLVHMEQDGAWGDHVILWAAASYFKTCIRVVSSLSQTNLLCWEIFMNCTMSAFNPCKVKVEGLYSHFDQLL